MHLQISSIQQHRDRIAQLQSEIKKYDDASAHAKNELNSIVSALMELRQNIRSSLGYKPLPEESALCASTLNPKAHTFQSESSSADVTASNAKRTHNDSSGDGNKTFQTDHKRLRMQEDDKAQQDQTPQPSKDNGDIPDQPSSSTPSV